MTCQAAILAEDCFDQKQVNLYDDAVQSRVVFPDWLSSGLDGAARCGTPLPALNDMVAFFDIDSNQLIDRGPFSGRAPTGEVIEFAETLPWVTARTRYGWGLPARETIDALLPIVSASGLLEVGCGTGYWTAVLRHAVPNADIIAVDTGVDTGDGWLEHPWTEIGRIDGVDAVRASPDLPVLLVWPDTARNFTPALARALSPGQRLMVAGPIEAVGCDEFWRQIDTDFDCVDAIPCIKTTGGKADALRIFVKRATANRAAAPRFLSHRTARRPAWLR